MEKQERDEWLTTNFSNMVIVFSLNFPCLKLESLLHSRVIMLGLGLFVRTTLIFGVLLFGGETTSNPTPPPLFRL